MDFINLNLKTNDEDLCLVGGVTMHTILKDKKYFTDLILSKANMNTISSVTNLIESSERAIIMLPRGTKIIINDTLYSSESRRNLLSFKDIINDTLCSICTNSSIIAH